MRCIVTFNIEKKRNIVQTAAYLAVEFKKVIYYHMQRMDATHFTPAAPLWNFSNFDKLFKKKKEKIVWCCILS